MPGLPVINTSLLCFSLLYKLHSKKQMILMSTCAIHHSFLNCHIQYFPDDYSKSCLGLHMSTSKSLVCVMQFVTQTENKETHKLISSKYFDRHFTYQYYILHTAEQTWKCGKKHHWSWLFCNLQVALFSQNIITMQNAIQIPSITIIWNATCGYQSQV